MTKTMRESASVVALGSAKATGEPPPLEAAFHDVQSSFETFCLLAGIEAFQDLLEEEAADLCGERHQRHEQRRGRRWGTTKSAVAFHGGRVGVQRPRVRTPDGRQELELASFAAGQREDWLGQWALNQMLINVSTRRFRRSVRLPDGDVASVNGDGTSKSAVSRKFVALSAAKLQEWMASDLSPLDLLAIQIDGLHVTEDLILVAAMGIDADGAKHPLGLVEGATENAATVRALLDNLIERGLDPAVVRLFIIDGAKALAKAIRRTFGKDTPIQRCQVHKARNIAERLPKEAHAAVRKTLRQAWELDDAAKAEQLIRNLARRLEKDWPGIAATILEGLDEILCVVRLKVPKDLRRSLACTNIIENMNGTIRQVTRNVKRWRDASMALRWAAA
ncbi:IS256 family transposase, partial [Azospirillum sp.]|uniref:IS256 family transposase n=1 Tax=Azospirillum sp. TaxID=34012 RepID=UPI002603B3B5